MKRNGSRAVFSCTRGRIVGLSALGITAAGLLTLLSLTIGCGIETLPYLEAPVIGGSEPFPNLQHSTLNTIDEFAGYDFYYRFFPDREAFQQNPVNTSITGESNLVSRGYRRMIARKKTEDEQPPAQLILTPPILRIPDNLKSTQLDFEYELPDGILQDEPQILPPPAYASEIPPLFLMRNIGTPASPEPLSFLEPFSADQHDLSTAGISNIASLNEIIIAIYVIAVGYDLTSFAPIRSTPVFGGLTTFIPN